ncbi:MAG: C45 family peptidase [Candidatus Paceibacterota bacterium]
MRFNFKIGLLFLLLVVLNSCGISKSINHQPIVEKYNQTTPEINRNSDTFFTYKSNFLYQNEYDLWELKASGDPLQIGLITGALTQPLLHYQEEVFFEKVEELVPSKFKQNLLRSFLKWYNRKLYFHVPEEYKTEIYGLSRYAGDTYNYIAPPYLRMLYLHAAHDIGHAMQDLALVGCTSVAVWGENTEDGQLLIGRNFDFYAGDDFAKNKIIAFVEPESGYPFMSVTWAGMIGVVSGMNNQGLTVTMNAGKSEIPMVAKTPVSILAREILQYAKNIEEAISISKKREVFVSESIMIGSAEDQKAVLIEVSPDNFGVYEVSNQTHLICSNHFQSEAYKDDERNIQHIEESHSKYRFDRVEELLEEQQQLNPPKIAALLRDREGLNNRKIGYGNEKALNQLLAHHAVIFKPEEKMVWVSSNPYQLGAFVAYDLDEIFGKTRLADTTLAIKSKTIPEAPFLNSIEYKNYEEFRVYDRKIDNALSENEPLSVHFIMNYQALNSDHWVVYYKVGKYYQQNKWYKAAAKQYEKALSKEVTTLVDVNEIEKQLKKVKRKIKK